MIDINQLSEQAYNCAVRRGKITKDTDYEDWMKAISSEVIELSMSNIEGRKHISFEMADIVITLLSMSKYYGIDLEIAILDKMEFNEKRSD